MAYLQRSPRKSKDSSGTSKAIGRIRQAEQAREVGGYDKTWSSLIKLYGGMYDYPELAQYVDVVAPNMAFSTVNVIVPSITVNYPKITVTPRREDMTERSQLVETAANYYWRHGNVHDEFRAATKDFVILGHGWIKTTWEYEEKQVEMSPDEWKQEVTQLLVERNMAQVEAQSRGLDVSFPSDEEIVRSVPTTKTITVKDQPLVERISPFDLFVDPTVTRLKDARWVAQRLYVPIEVAKKNPAWNAKVREDISPVALKREKVEVLKDGERPPDGADYAVVWEYYDLIAETMGVFADGSDDWLMAPEPVDLPFPHPFVFVPNYLIPEKFYPLGDVEMISALQRELAITRTQMVNDRKRYRRMYLARTNELGEDAMNAIQSEDDNVVIDVEGDRPFSDIFAAVETTMLPTEFYNQTAMILDDINQVSGVFEFQRGGQSEIRRTATEAAMIQDASNARSADKLAAIERAIGAVAENVVQLAQKNLTSRQVAKVVSEDGATQWVEFDSEDIAGEYDFEVEAGSTQPQNETFRRQSALQLMDTMAGFIQAGVVDPHKLAEHVMKNGFGIKTPEKFLIYPQPQQVPPEGAPPDGGAPMPAGGDPMAGLPPEMAAMLG